MVATEPGTTVYVDRDHDSVPDETYSATLPGSHVEITATDGVHVYSDKPTSVAYLYQIRARDPWNGYRTYESAYLMLPESMLGTTYRVTRRLAGRPWGPDYVSLQVVVLQDDTTIQLDRNKDGVVDVSVTLDKGEVHVFIGWRATPILEGALLTASKPVACYIWYVTAWAGVDEEQSALVLTPVKGRGLIEGTVVHPRGEGIPDATVSAIDPTTGEVVKEVETGPSGYFSASVAPGTYEVESSKTGTVDNTKTVSVGAGEIVTTTLMNPWLQDQEAKEEAS